MKKVSFVVRISQKDNKILSAYAKEQFMSKNGLLNKIIKGFIVRVNKNAKM